MGFIHLLDNKNKHFKIILYNRKKMARHVQLQNIAHALIRMACTRTHNFCTNFHSSPYPTRSLPCFANDCTRYGCVRILFPNMFWHNSRGVREKIWKFIEFLTTRCVCVSCHRPVLPLSCGDSCCLLYCIGLSCNAAATASPKRGRCEFVSILAHPAQEVSFSLPACMCVFVYFLIRNLLFPRGKKLGALVWRTIRERVLWRKFDIKRNQERGYFMLL